MAGGTEPGWPRDHAAAAERVRAHLPGGSRARLRPLGEGDFCLAFRQHTRIVRVARHAEAAAALAREACVLAAIGDTLPLPVPRPAFHHPGDGCAFSVHAGVRGAVLTRARWERLPAGAREEAARSLGRFLHALHALPAAPAVACGVPVLRRAEFAARLRPAAARLAERLEPGIAARLDAALASWSSAELAEPDGVVLHRDVAPGHVLFDSRDGRLTGVIDFGDLAVGDPARDFIYVYEDFGPRMLAAVLRGYAREDAAALLPRARMWYLLEALAWTVDRAEEGHAADVEHGLGEVANELDVLGM